MHLLLIRHGATEWNLRGLLQGQTDVSLSEEGRRQVQEIVPFFRTYDPDQLWVSPLRRARETADILSLGMTVPLRVDARLMERSFGILEGLSRPDQTARHPEVRAGLKADPIDYAPPEGESYRAFWDRVEALSRDLLEADGKVAVVAHGGTIRILLGLFLGTGPESAPHITLDNAHVSLVDVAGGRPRIQGMNLWMGEGVPGVPVPRATP